MNTYKPVIKTEEVITAICDFGNMKLIVTNTPDEIKEQRNRLTSPKSTNFDAIPGEHNPHAMEESWIAGIDKLDLMIKRYNEARLFVLWFEPMWLALTEQERQLLETYKVGTVMDLASELRYSPRHVTRLREQATAKLSFLLFGR